MRTAIAMLLALAVFAARPIPQHYYYVDLPLEAPEQIGKLRQQGYDIAGIDLEKKIVSIVLRSDQLSQLDRQQVRSLRPISRYPDEEYLNPQEVATRLNEIEDRYPYLATVRTIGQTIEGKDILAIQLTSRFVVPGPEPKPTVLFDSVHHAREIMTSEVTMDIIDYLTKNYFNDPQVRNWLNNYEVWVVPMVNADGSNKVWNGSSMWRKNTRNGYGVDINRNYSYDWNGCNGSSGNPSSDTYRGDSPASEPETQAMMKLASDIKPVFNISYHSYSEIVIYPFGCSPKQVPSPDKETYLRIGRDLAKSLIRDSGNGSYTAGTAYELLYDVDGGSIDWMYGENDTMSYVVEVNSSSQGFQPSYQQWRDTTVERQRKGWQYILKQMEHVLAN